MFRCAWAGGRDSGLMLPICRGRFPFFAQCYNAARAEGVFEEAVNCSYCLSTPSIDLRETGLDIKRGKARHGTVERRLESPVGVENRRIRYKPPILSGEAHKDRKPQRRQLPRSQCPNFRAPVAPVRRSRGQS